MKRYTPVLVALFAFVGCVAAPTDNAATLDYSNETDVYSGASPVIDAPSDVGACAVASDCKASSLCKIPECIDGECSTRNELDGSSCKTNDDNIGVCEAGACVNIDDVVIMCGGPLAQCGKDSDCFVRQCTNSMCVNGQCVHVPYENGARCFNDSSGVVVAGQCYGCECQ